MDIKRNLSRSKSIFQAPEKLLLDAVKDNKLQKIKRLVKENKELLSYKYFHPYFGTILYVACSEENISSDTVELLLQLGAKPFEETEGQGEIIHVLSRQTNPRHIKVLLKYLTKEEINHVFRGNNALLVLVKEGEYVKRADFLECAKLLIGAGISVNHADFKNFTAILWAIKKDYESFIKLLLKNCSDLDIDNYSMNGKTARELIISKYDAKFALPDNSTITISRKDLLFGYLKSNEEDAFVSYNHGDISEFKDIDDSTQTLLQLSCELGLTKAAKHLLDNEADVRKITRKQPKTPLELAAENGHINVVEVLLGYDESLKVPSSTLSILLKKIYMSDVSENFERCFDELLRKQDGVSLNSAPSHNFQQTPLHYAVIFAKNKHNILELLRRGSSLANKNEFGIMPIENIKADVLDQHLDDCIDINDVDKNNIYVTLNYKTLLPSPVLQNGCAGRCEEGRPVLSQKLAPETDALLYMCKAPYLKHLLTHPVIDTFLLLKWHKINMIFYTNLFFYVLFITSLFAYIFSSYGNFNYIAEKESLLIIAKISHFTLCFTYVLLFLRELFQILVNPLEYYKDIDNWIEVILIFLVGFIIFLREPSNDTRKQLSSLAILLSTFELVLMVEEHPTFTIKVVMFKRVSINFIIFLSWSFLLIVAFAMSFYILFSENVEQKSQRKNENVEKDDEGNNFFMNPGKALFKTLVMLTGEFDAGDMNFHSFPITSRVIFIMFVLLIAIILLNLLNGLAVSDTQSIKSDAECVGFIARTGYIHYIESLVFGNILPTKFLNFINDRLCFSSLKKIPFINISHPLRKHISLYPATEIKISMPNEFEMMNVSPVFNSLKVNQQIRKAVIENQRMVNSEAYIKIKIKHIEKSRAEILEYFKSQRNINAQASHV